MKKKWCDSFSNGLVTCIVTYKDLDQLIKTLYALKRQLNESFLGNILKNGRKYFAKRGANCLENYK